ncbi:MAG: CPBP family intramembrane metalloprotease [Thaumarchaeota archaeon]|nr:MAG: CPBP family intramembrane metalloprotease [Nitrososphaerota archaeon]
MAHAERYALASLPVAFFLWYVTFQVNALSFWERISLSTVILLFVSLSLGRSGMRLKPSGRALAVGVLSAILLYLFFWSGFQFLKGNSTFVQQVSSVYILRSSEPSYLIFLLLIFPIGPAEETYWRGLIQRELQRKMSGRAAIIVTSALYSLIHLPTLNPSLIFVALVGGLVWGYLFRRYNNDLLPCLVSHILFDELVFVALPIG